MKRCSFEKINKMDELLARMTREGDRNRERLNINDQLISKEIGDITTDTYRLHKEGIL